MQPHTTRRAFTLIELLVVVSIIGLLIGILVPTLSAARSSAQATACLSDVRAMALASLQYSLEHDDRMVDVGLEHGQGTVGQGEPGSFITTLSSYTQTPLLRRCPSDTSDHWSDEDGGAGIPVPQSSPPAFRKTSYGISNMLTIAEAYNQGGDYGYWRDIFGLQGAPTQDAYPRLSRVKRPASVIQFVEMTRVGEFAGSDHIHVEDIGVPGGTAAPAQFAANAFAMIEINQHGGKVTRPDGNPNTPPDVRGPLGKANYTFLDGSAKTLTFGEVFSNPTTNFFDARSGQ